MNSTCRPVITAVLVALLALPVNTIPAVEPLAGMKLLEPSIMRASAHAPIGMSASSTATAGLSPAPAVIDLTTGGVVTSGGVIDGVVSDPPDRSAQPYDTGLAGSAVGQLLSPSGSCTATMIPSVSGQIAVTAAHCVYVHAQRPQSVDPPLGPGWIEDLVFVPGRTGDRAPHGEWSVVRVWIDSSYRDTAAPVADVAFLELARREGPTAQEVLGAEGIRFRDHPPTGQPATMLGYPVGAPFDGTQLRRCTTPALTTPYADHPGEPSGDGFGDLVAMTCVMTEGSSGGPWLTGFDAATGSGTLTAVTSFRSQDDPDLILAAPLGPLAEALLRAADTRAGGTVTETEPDAETRTETGSARRAASGDAGNGRVVMRLPASSPDRDSAGSPLGDMEAE